MNFAIAQIEEYKELLEDNTPQKTKKAVFDSCTAGIKLYRLIQLGIQFKYLTSEDFQYENGTVYSIKGLEYDEDLNFFALTGKKGAIVHAAANKGSCNHLEKTADRWVKDYNTNVNIKI